MRIILISGTAGSGKDTVGGILRDAYEGDGFKVLITHFADLVKYVCANFYGWNSVKDIHGRSILQKVGTDIVRKWKEDYWVDFLIDMLSLFGHMYDYVIIPDARFPNEVSKIKEKWPDTIHLRIERHNFQSHLTEEQQRHSSETALGSVMPDVWIKNDGDLVDLVDLLNDFVVENKSEEQLEGQISIDEWLETI